MNAARATLDVSAGRVTLYAPGLGTVGVTAAEVTWQETDGAGAAELVACLGEWAWGQQQLLRGVTVCRGTVVVTAWGAVLLAAISGSGASLTAAPLVLGGASVLADGACPLVVADGTVTALPGRSSLELDPAVAASWPHPDAVTPLGCGRPRALVEGTPVAGPTALTAVVLLRRGGGSGDAPLDPGRAAHLLACCLVPSLVHADRNHRAAAAQAIVAAVPVAEVSVADPPPAVARAVLETLAALGVAP